MERCAHDSNVAHLGLIWHSNGTIAGSVVVYSTDVLKFLGPCAYGNLQISCCLGFPLDHMGVVAQL